MSAASCDWILMLVGEGVTNLGTDGTGVPLNPPIKRGGNNVEGSGRCGLFFYFKYFQGFLIWRCKINFMN